MIIGIRDNYNLPCECNNTANVVGFYLKGVANKKNYYVVCNDCNRRTLNRRKLEKAIDDWNNGKFRTK